MSSVPQKADKLNLSLPLFRGIGYIFIPVIDPSHKSHNASDKYLTIHHFVTETCTCMHISVTTWCIVGYGTGALWDLCNESIQHGLWAGYCPWDQLCNWGHGQPVSYYVTPFNNMVIFHLTIERIILEFKEHSQNWLLLFMYWIKADMHGFGWCC